MLPKYRINEEPAEIIRKSQEELRERFDEVDKIKEYNQEKEKANI